ncbi:MAG: hypothetical protein RLZZ15_1125, partial [Verrucomicrobiota bacterium]
MKTHSTPSSASSPSSRATAPRLACRVVRQWIAVVGDAEAAAAGAPRGLGAAHVTACADCREFFAATDALDLALTRDAAREWQTPPADLEHQILRAVQRAAASREPRASHLAFSALAGAVACLVLAMLALQDRSGPGPTGIARDSAHTVAATTAPAPTDPRELWTTFKPSAGAVLAAEPLQREVDAMKSDARRAVLFLARNFLP